MSPLFAGDKRSNEPMGSENKTPAIIESPSDWEAGNAPTPVAHDGYSRSSHTHSLEEGLEAETNSDLGNQGRDVHEEELVTAGQSR